MVEVKKILVALGLVAFLAACGDDDSSVFPDSVGDLPSSESLSSSDDNSSSSSVKSSSSGKSSSSTDDKSSSSSDDLFLFSSSSLPKELMCFVECTEDCEGVTYHHKDGFQMICRSGQWLNLDSMENANTSSSSYFDMTNQFNEKVSYGEFTDPRDEQKYRTVDIYDKVYDRTYTIFAENLNYGKMVMGGSVQGDSTKYCYDDDPWYCENGWGGLYTWSNAMGFPAVCDSVSISAEACSQKFVYPSGHIEPEDYVQHQGACPEGWHIMNGGEWAFLSETSHGDVGYYMGSKVAGFGKENLYGMSLLPAGYWERAPNGSLVFYGLKQQTNFWMAKQYSNDEKMALIVWMGSTGYHRDSPALKANFGYSVRCVKDY